MEEYKYLLKFYNASDLYFNQDLCKQKHPINKYYDFRIINLLLEQLKKKLLARLTLDAGKVDLYKEKIKEIESDLTVGRVLVRASGTESKIRVMVESDDE